MMRIAPNEEFLENVRRGEYFQGLYRTLQRLEQDVIECAERDDLVAVPRGASLDIVIDALKRKEEELRLDGTYIVNEREGVVSYKGSWYSLSGVEEDIFLNRDVFKRELSRRNVVKTIKEKLSAARHLYHYFARFHDNGLVLAGKRVAVRNGVPADYNRFPRPRAEEFRAVVLEDTLRALQAKLVGSLDDADIGVYVGRFYCDVDDNDSPVLKDMLSAMREREQMALVTIVDGRTSYLCANERILKELDEFGRRVFSITVHYPPFSYSTMLREGVAL
jgi:hypothetical protein